jgi:hypothetical protein
MAAAAGMPQAQFPLLPEKLLLSWSVPAAAVDITRVRKARAAEAEVIAQW